MISRIKITALALFTGLCVQAQNYQFTWLNSIGSTGADRGLAVATDGFGSVYTSGALGGVAAIGSATLTTAQGKIYLARYSDTGIPLWAKVMGGSSQEESRSITTDPSGDICLTGIFSGTSVFGTNTLSTAGSSDVFVMKLNSAGAVLWAKRMGGAGADESRSITTDASGNVLTTGRFSGTAVFGTFTLSAAGGDDIFIVKQDASGAVLWAKQAGGSGTDEAMDVEAGSAGDIFITGHFAGSASFGTVAISSNAASDDAFVAKYNASGAALWAVPAGSSGGDYGQALVVDPLGNSYATGVFSGTVSFGSSTFTSAGAPDVYLLKYDPAGAVLWARQWGGTAVESVKDLSRDVLGNLYALGGFSGAAVFGSTTLTAQGGDDIFVTKCDPTGNIIWAKPAGGISGDYAGSLGADPTGNLYITGYVGGTAQFGAQTMSVTGSDDAFVTKITCVAGISGAVTSTLGNVNGNVLLYRQSPNRNKWDLVETAPVISSAYTFTAVEKGFYAVEAVPVSPLMQETYGPSGILWQDATLMTHLCTVSSSMNINVIPFTTVVAGNGELSGQITEGPGFGNKPLAPGNPIAGVTIKVGIHPGAYIFGRVVTPADGKYSFLNLPDNQPGEHYFVVPDIAGLDTTKAYHVPIAQSAKYTGLDFTADSVYVKTVKVLDVSLARNAAEELQLRAYPNPAGSYVNIDYVLTTASPVRLVLADMLGREIMARESFEEPAFGGSTQRLDLSGLNEGVYLLKIRVNGRESCLRLLVGQ